jgi:parallel beta-helix repeat protein
MATIYVDPTAAGPGAGTLASPFQSWTSVAWVPGNTYLQKRGTTYAGVFTLSTSGTRFQRITVGAYFRPDGSDDPRQPRPVIILPPAPATPANGASIAVQGQERDFVTYRHLDIRNNAAPEASDVAIIWLGHDCAFDNNRVASNCGGVYIYGKNSVTVSNCVLDVVSCNPAFSNHGILLAENFRIDDNRLLNNTIHHRGGGSASSHGIRCETYDSAARITNLVIRGNTISPSPGQDYTANRGAIGIYLVHGLAAVIDRNTVTGMLTGIFIGTGERNYVGNNSLSRNMNFGLHITGFAKTYLIENNTCNYNGGTLAPTCYGRGIELSSAAGTHAVSEHTIRRNTCMYNYNYGGPADNGSEGVGIGLDDGTSRCSVYGNTISNNEGNGIQLYGGGDRERFTDTGGNTIMSNRLESNCTFSVLDRRTGGTAPSPFYAHVHLSYIYGARTLIMSNIFSGTSSGGVFQDSTSSNVIAAMNIYMGFAYPMTPLRGQGEPPHVGGLPMAGRSGGARVE